MIIQIPFSTLQVIPIAFTIPWQGRVPEVVIRADVEFSRELERRHQTIVEANEIRYQAIMDTYNDND